MTKCVTETDDSVHVAHLLAAKLTERELEDSYVPQPLAARDTPQRVTVLVAIRHQGLYVHLYRPTYSC